MTEIADLQSRNQTKDKKLAEVQQQLIEKVSFQSLIHPGTAIRLFRILEFRIGGGGTCYCIII